MVMMDRGPASIQGVAKQERMLATMIAQAVLAVTLPFAPIEDTPG
jgi:hypothetical protein